MRWSTSAIVVSETGSSDILTRVAAVIVEASTVLPRSMRACTASTRRTWRAYSSAVIVESVSCPIGRLLESSRGSATAAIASGDARAELGPGR